MTTTLNHNYSPRNACKDVLENRDAQVIIHGPAGTGKSRSALEKLHLLCLLNPSIRCLIVRKTLTSLTSSALVTWREHVVKEAIQAGVLQYFGGNSEEPAQYRYSNGSVVVIGGMDRATRVLSTEYDFIYVQECTELSEEDWDVLTTRLRNNRLSFQQLVGDCNPDKPTHWAKVRADKGKLTFLHSKHEDNPVLFNEDGTVTEKGAAYISILDNLSGVRKLRLRHGVWAAAEGLIYEEFESHIHLLDSFAIPRSWNRYWVVDFGYTNPFVCQNWAEDEDGRLYLYREFYKTQQTVDVHAKRILQEVTDCLEHCGEHERVRGECKDCSDCKFGWTEPKPSKLICDHDAENRAVLERELGIRSIAAKKSVADGIQAVKRRLKLAGDGKPRLFIVRNALVERDQELALVKKPTSTEEEFPGYVWDQSTASRKDKEQPLKQDDHGMDCTRYMVAHKDLKNRANLRFLE